jgi:cellulose synthase/poly-beta-1,6-N-acetylglucosamine synthase-like glycosyltransferase/peptidoglycan/xylan/chitin deacetylase (PgdA/CDA1 family)
VGLGIAVLTYSTLLNHKAPILVGTPTAPDPTAQRIPGPAALAGAGPIAVGDLAGGVPMPTGQVSLTFDDGPHPVWTPLILDELDRLDVTATFFVVGERVTEYRYLARAIVDRGHEIANHTQLHPQMGQLTERQIKAQLDLARLAIVNATGLESDLYRPPYSAAVGNFDQAESVAAQTAVEYGYTLIATDRAPKDFDTDLTPADLLNDALPAAGAGTIITLHDGGGADRANTVAVLEPLVNRLRAEGYAIVPVGAVVEEMTGRAPIRTVSQMTELRATAHHWTLTIGGAVESMVMIGAISFVVLYLGRAVFLIGSALRAQRRKRHSRTVVGDWQPAVSVIVPAYNEAVGIADAVRSIAASDHEQVEILVIDDGSTDETADIVESLDLENVTVIRRLNGGKASALNAGISLATHDVVVMVDGDTLLEPRTIPELIKPLVDPDVGAVAGNPKIGNGTNWLARLQQSEYLISSSLERRVLAPAGMITTIPGAIGAWRQAALRDVGKVSTTTLAEDTDLTVAVARGGWKVAYTPRARAWTEAPSTVQALTKQRTRWTFGTLQVLWKHRRAISDRGAGSQVGRLALPYMFVVGYLLAALAPLMDLVLLINVLLGKWELAVVMWAIIALFGLVSGLVAATLDGDKPASAVLVPIQQLVFRPLLHAVTLITLRRAILGEPQQWGVQQRTGGLRPRNAVTT